MRILQINNLHYISGGTERYYLELSELLKKNNHQIAFFSTTDNRNNSTKYNKYFVDLLFLQNIEFKNLFNIISTVIYSLQAKKKINQLLDDFRPDIVHIHNIYNHISPSILPEIKKRGIPIVQTVHNFHLLAPSRNLFHDNSICEITKPDDYYKAIFHKCIKNSYAASALTVFTMYIHRIFGLYSKYVDYYITPSLFMKNKMIEYGFKASKILVLPYFVNPKPIKKINSQSKNKYILYFGRLSPEKGLFFLLDVISTLPLVQFKIVGEGHQEQLLKEKVKNLHLKNVEFTGYLQGDRLTKQISGSYFTILPSIWYDNLPYSILESFSLSKPVVASRIGGIPEMVKDGITGYRFEPNNLEDCRKKILKLWNDPKLVEKMGKNSYKLSKVKYNQTDHYKKILKIYNRAMSKGN